MGITILNKKHSFKEYKKNKKGKNFIKKRWIAKVECNKCKKIFYPFLENVTRGLTTSCRSCSTTKHGGSGTALYKVWVSMIQRCTNNRNKKYLRYGGRGITVCEEWRNSFEAFKLHMDTLLKVGKTIDRIDNNGNYEPGNVRWATYSMQNLNREKLKEPMDRKAYMKVYNKKNWKKYKDKTYIKVRDRKA